MNAFAASSYGGSNVSQRPFTSRFSRLPERVRRYIDGRPPLRPFRALEAFLRALVRLPRATACGFLCDGMSLPRLFLEPHEVAVADIVVLSSADAAAQPAANRVLAVGDEPRTVLIELPGAIAVAANG